MEKLVSARLRIGRYEVGRTLGEGRFAEVKFARHIDTGVPVAIKIIKKDRLCKVNKLVKQEITSMKLIKHPHVVKLLEVMASKQNVDMILEYVSGGELLDKINENEKLKEDEARRYFRQLIYGVDYCHSRGVYHRDLKVMDEKGYEGTPADLWSCGIILYVLLVGALPFSDSNLGNLYQKNTCKKETKFTSRHPAREILAKIKEFAG